MFVLRALLVAALAFTPMSAAIPQTRGPAPVDMAARIKVPNEDGAAVDFVAYVNTVVNQMIQPMGDLEHYGVDDLWVQYPKDMKGDCEDYAITKEGLLGRAGFPIVSDSKLVPVIVHSPEGDEGHMILAVRLPKGAVLYLDNMNSEPMTRRELKAEGYEFFDWRA